MGICFIKPRGIGNAGIDAGIVVGINGLFGQDRILFYLQNIKITPMDRAGIGGCRGNGVGAGLQVEGYVPNKVNAGVVNDWYVLSGCHCNVIAQRIVDLNKALARVGSLAVVGSDLVVAGFLYGKAPTNIAICKSYVGACVDVVVIDLVINTVLSLVGCKQLGYTVERMKEYL